MIQEFAFLCLLWKRYLTIVSLYKKYLYQSWPLTSYHKNDLSIMNVGFPDNTSVLHFSTFRSDQDVLLSGEYPDNCLYWNLVFYDTFGRAFASIEQCDFPSRSYQLFLSQKKNLRKNIRVIAPPTKYFCALQRIFSVPYSTLFPMYLPNITYCDGSDVYSVSPTTRVQDSIEFQKTFYTLLSLRRNYISKTLKDQVNLHDFFLPGRNYMERFFWNPTVMMLFAFPKRGKLMKIKGSLPNIGHDCFLQYISFMTCDFQTTETDECSPYFGLPHDYEIFVSDNPMVLYKKGYQHTLSWNPSTKNPVFVMYLVFSSFHSVTPYQFMKTRDPVDATELRKWFGDILPLLYHE